MLNAWINVGYLHKYDCKYCDLNVHLFTRIFFWLFCFSKFKFSTKIECICQKIPLNLNPVTKDGRSLS